MKDRVEIETKLAELMEQKRLPSQQLNESSALLYSGIQQRLTGKIRALKWVLDKETEL